MPTKAEHVLRSADNIRFFEGLKNLETKKLEWQVTTIFYAALHLVDGRLEKYGIHPRNHGQRNQEVQNHPDLQPIWRQYERLQKLSRRARYEPDLPAIGPGDVASAWMLFERVEAHINGLAP